jgi:hypothetical protein
MVAKVRRSFSCYCQPGDFPINAAQERVAHGLHNDGMRVVERRSQKGLPAGETSRILEARQFATGAARRRPGSPAWSSLASGASNAS